MKEMIGVIAGISAEAIVKELLKKEYMTLVISGRKDDSGMDISTKSYVSDLKEKEQILNYLNENSVKKVIIGTGHILAFQLAEYLMKNKIKVSINPESSLKAKDKFIYKEELINCGINTPKYLLLKKDEKTQIEKILKEIALPCVVKSVVDTLYPKKANSLKELEEYIEEVQETNSDVLLEEYIEGVDITVPVISNLKQQEAILVSYYSKAKECKLKGFEGIKNEKRLTKETEEKVLRFSEMVIKKTNITGLARLDIIVNKEEKFYVLECNSVMVTGVHQNQIEYGREFLEKEKVNFAKIMVENAIKIFDEGII